MYEYAKGRFVNPARIVTAHVYEKQDGGPNSNPESGKTIRVAIELDVSEATKTTIYSDPFAELESAYKYCQSLPVLAQSKK